MAFNWIEERVKMIKGKQVLVDSLVDITERITKIKKSMASYKTDIENFMKIVNEKNSFRYRTETITLDEVNEEIKDKVLRINHDFLPQKYQEIKDAVSNVVKSTAG